MMQPARDADNLGVFWDADNLGGVWEPRSVNCAVKCPEMMQLGEYQVGVKIMCS